MIDEIIDWYDLFNERERVEFSEKYVLPLELMLYDLLENKLEVEKVFPDKEKYMDRYFQDGCGIRSKSSSNVEWYCELCKMHTKPEYKISKIDGKKIKRRFRKNPQTNLKRSDVISVLNHMIKKRTSKSKHSPYLLDIAQKYRESFKDNEEEMKKVLGYDDFEFKPWDEKNPRF